MAKQQYRFCFGPWNISEGQDPYGPTTRPAQTFDWKLDQLQKLGFEAMMFHDDDAVPDIDDKSGAQIKSETKRADGPCLCAHHRSCAGDSAVDQQSETCRLPHRVGPRHSRRP